MERKELCAFGIEGKKRLVEMNRPQEWLIEQVAEDTGQYFDSGYLQKIWTGERNPPKIIASISKILGLDGQDTA
ncbi:XRE family transcriptional regulator [Ruminococcaceae bacterium OttesenSCG-928-D13]|nr:XRE family transcriptional regulator [Ruminococcaceae bacterium OttesenSCG-928-D13]